MTLIYADDLTPNAAFKCLLEDASTYLIDVRTKAETIFVGTPNLSDLPNAADLTEKYCLIEWQLFPSMQTNDNFIAELSAKLKQWQDKDGVEAADRNLLFLCRSGVRSAYAADVATKMGCNKSYNISGGFEGDVDDGGHRSHLSGWKFTGLPWSQ
ncbi:MAG: rhodanese-like domain-containing protein [OCS116 cluster bacterium]|uniref:Sulfurtransferase n=1 Tax=OCS116 cluster bacterium TaxID=2030921 RepID=A0A2A4Z668_9PROT|nr:rhodanese-like domain-containing protein [OCS116 cluster bacterium]